MTMVSSGPISLGGTATTGGLNQSINVELGRSGTATINLNESAVRTLLAVPSGAISLSNAYGKSNRAAVAYTISSNTANASINVASLSGYSAGTSDITITVNAGVYVYSTSTGTPALTLSGGTTGDTVTLVNNGFIMGQGGTGAGSPANPGVGGPAISLGFNTTINNTNASAYIGGGGGGGAGGYAQGGGGAGGGAATGTGSGGGGGLGSSGGNGSPYSYSGTYGLYQAAGGGGGGRIFPGTGGAGGGSGSYTNWYGRGGGAGGGGASGASVATGGAGGSANSAGGGPGGGGAGPYGGAGAGGGGGWGASGGNTGNPSYLGAAGGKAVALNGRTVTWVSGDTARVYGAIS